MCGVVYFKGIKLKWFKHDTDCALSEGLSFLIEMEGWAGYGRWFRLLEIVASKMDKTPRCHAEYSIQRWCSLLGLKHKKLRTFLELTENKLKTKVVCSGNIIKISIPNLLNKRDNYTKDLVVTTKKLPSKEVEVEVEVDKDINTLGDFENFWEKYPSRNGKKMEKAETYKRFLKIPKEEIPEVLQAVKNYSESELVKKGVGIKDPKRFILDGKGNEFWREWIKPEKSEYEARWERIDKSLQEDKQ